MIKHVINDTNSFGTKLPQGDHKVRKSQTTLTVFRPGFFLIFRDQPSAMEGDSGRGESRGERGGRRESSKFKNI